MKQLIQNGILAWMGAALCLAALSGPAQAAGTPNTAAAGKGLAEKYCTTCHVIAPTGKSGWTDAPPFDAIARRTGSSVAGLSAYIQQSHAHMMHDQRPKDEADALATYIMSLRGH